MLYDKVRMREFLEKYRSLCLEYSMMLRESGDGGLMIDEEVEDCYINADCNAIASCEHL